MKSAAENREDSCNPKRFGWGHHIGAVLAGWTAMATKRSPHELRLPGDVSAASRNSDLCGLQHQPGERLARPVRPPRRHDAMRSEWPGLLRTPNGLINDGRQFFIKLNYLWRP